MILHVGDKVRKPDGTIFTITAITAIIDRQGADAMLDLESETKTMMITANRFKREHWIKDLRHDRQLIIRTMLSIYNNQADSTRMLDNLESNPGEDQICGEYHRLYYDIEHRKFVVIGIPGKEIFASTDRPAVLDFLKQLSQMNEYDYADEYIGRSQLTTKKQGKSPSHRDN